MEYNPKGELVYRPKFAYDTSDTSTSASASNSAPISKLMFKKDFGMVCTIKEKVRKTREEGKIGEIVRGTGFVTFHRDSSFDFNDYKPCQLFPFQQKPLALVTIHNEFGKNILGIQFQSRVGIYELEFKHERNTHFYTLTKIQEFITATTTNQQTELQIVSSISISPASTLRAGGPLGSGTLKELTYAISLVEDKYIRLVTEKIESGKCFSPEVGLTSELAAVLDGHKAGVKKVVFDVEHGNFMASLSDDAVCIIWDIQEKKPYTEAPLSSPGVDCLWHKSEPYKLLIVEREGRIRMFNILKNCSIFTFHTLAQPIYSADWALTNSMIIGVGTNKSAYLYDISVLNSEPGTRVDTHLGPTNAIKFSTTSSQHFATGCFFQRSEIKVYHKNFRNFVWSQKRESFQSIAWIYGTPILLAASGNKLLVYESSLV